MLWPVVWTEILNASDISDKKGVTKISEEAHIFWTDGNSSWNLTVAQSTELEIREVLWYPRRSCSLRAGNMEKLWKKQAQQL